MCIKILALALRSMVLSVLKGSGQNLKGEGGGAASFYVSLARTLDCNTNSHNNSHVQHTIVSCMLKYFSRYSIHCAVGVVMSS